eukprot:gene23121-30322_t
MAYIADVARNLLVPNSCSFRWDAQVKLVLAAAAFSGGPQSAHRTTFGTACRPDSIAGQTATVVELKGCFNFLGPSLTTLKETAHTFMANFVDMPPVSPITSSNTSNTSRLRSRVGLLPYGIKGAIKIANAYGASITIVEHPEVLGQFGATAWQTCIGWYVRPRYQPSKAQCQS